MSNGAQDYRIGEVTITRVTETIIDMAPPERLFPDWQPQLLAGEERRLAPGAPASLRERIPTSVHSWLVKTPKSTILVDTGIGNGKTRPQAFFAHLDTPFLERLLAAGVTPEQVDHVLITHIHTDHVGWNTKMIGERWVPTFPNATYIFPRRGHDYFSSAEGRARPNHGMYEDSIVPVIATGQARMVEPEGGEVLPGISYLPTPGHSVDHMSISLTSHGEEALFAGDTMHSPIQVHAPQLSSVFCADPHEARRSRARVLSYCADREALYLSSHFAETSAGRIKRANDGYLWDFE
jgi:glyoxylase-like metal-dependent hydrolase (beta-lactamase superfamily II)